MPFTIATWNINSVRLREGLVRKLMDIELAIDAMEQSDVVDHLVIFSGDGDFTSLVEALQRKGRKVTVVSSLSSQPPMIADDLRRQADYFIDLNSLKSEIGRDPSERPQRPLQAMDDDEDDFED